MKADAQPELWDELKVDAHWFHVVRSMIMRNRIAEMGISAWSVYCVLKAYTQLDTGITWPSQGRIADHIGASVDTVARATDRLVELGIVEKRKVGRHNEYTMIEQIPLQDRNGEVVAFGEKGYAPYQFTRFIDELKAFAKTGEVVPGSAIKITLNVNFIQQGDNGTVNIQHINLADESSASNPPEVVNAIRARLKSLNF